MSYEFAGNNSGTEKESADMTTEFLQLWDDDRKLEALGLVLGREISDTEAKENEYLELVFEERTGVEAYEAALVVRALEEIHGGYDL